MLRSFGGSTAKSAQHWSPADLNLGDDDCLEALLAIVNKIIKEVTLPNVDWVSVIVFIGKQGGGERPIALLGALYTAIMGWLRPSLGDWSAEHTGF